MVYVCLELCRNETFYTADSTAEARAHSGTQIDVKYMEIEINLSIGRDK